MEGLIVFIIYVSSAIGAVLGLYEGTNGFNPVRERVALLRTFSCSIGALTSIGVLIITGVI